MSFFYPEVPPKEKNILHPHPWEKYIKYAYASTYKYGHNSAKNPIYPSPKKNKVPSAHRVKFTVIGNRVAKEFIYSMNLVKGLHKYRWKHFDAPVIKAVTSVEWPKEWNELKIRYGGEAYCLQSQVAVIANEQFLGGDKELKELVESKYIYHFKLDYYGEAVKLFSEYIKSSGRPCAYLQFMIDETEIGTMIFMLYADIAPRTCENFLRLCKETKGGYSGTPVHRIVPDSWIQCGGFGLKDSGLDCENFIVPHDRRGVLAMANDGRHVDCSTQFFILLQPQEWMASKYVAFGQLISGDATLKKIEQVPAWYESPKQKITIFKTGILNMECQDIMINKGTNEFIAGHVENLFTIGEMFYEALLEKVFLEAQFRYLQRLQNEMKEGRAEDEVTPEEVANNLRTTQRFMRKKEEIDKQLEKSQSDHSGKDSTAVAAERGENNDFDVEEYEYEAEELDSYKHVSIVASASVVVKPEKPFYIPLTDVPYFGEVDSEFNLKRLLQGDYCLESDLEKEAGKESKTNEVRQPFSSRILGALIDSESAESVTSRTENTLDSDDERKINNYLKNNSDSVSFAGSIIKTMAESGKFNLLKRQKMPDIITNNTDELPRKDTLDEEEDDDKSSKKVSMSIDPRASEICKEKVHRRQTGFTRPEDLARMRQFERKLDEDDDSDDEDDDDELDDQPYTRIDVGRKPDSPLNVHSPDSDDVEADENQRTSVLTRLIEEVAIEDDDGPGPTLKDYRPFSELRHKQNTDFLTYSPNIHLKVSNISCIAYFKRRRSLTTDRPHHHKAIDQVLLLQHGKKALRKISTDYVKTIDQIEQKEETSIRSLEFAKIRPTMSVRDYKKKNQEYREFLSKSMLAYETKEKPKW